MYVYEIAAIGGEGGGSYSHADNLKQAGYNLGTGANGMRLSKLYIHQWSVLSRHYGTYTSLKDSTQSFTTPAVGNIQGEGPETFEIPPGCRVTRVCVQAGDRSWTSGGDCLNMIEMEVTPVTSQRPVSLISIGDCKWDLEQRQAVGTRLTGSAEDVHCQVVCVPAGLTLAGITGRAGDSWDKVCLLVCPWLPENGVWSAHVHKHLLLPFKQQVRALLLCLNEIERSQDPAPAEHIGSAVVDVLVSALFKVTFLADTQAGAAGGADFIAAHVQQQVQQARLASETVLEEPFSFDLRSLEVSEVYCDSSDEYYSESE